MFADDYSKITCKIPEMLCLKQNYFGELGVFVTKDFKKGDFIYRNKCVIAERNRLPQTIVLETESGNYNLDRDRHTCNYMDKVMLYTYDSFMNHHCDPNSDSVSDKDNIEYYDTYAKRDISAGEELNCNYLLFYFTSQDPFDCQCGSKLCFGKINGFENLPREHQLLLKNDIHNFFYECHDLSFLNK